MSKQLIAKKNKFHINLYCIETKRGVDSIDQMEKRHTTRRSTRRYSHYRHCTLGDNCCDKCLHAIYRKSWKKSKDWIEDGCFCNNSNWSLLTSSQRFAKKSNFDHGKFIWEKTNNYTCLNIISCYIPLDPLNKKVLYISSTSKLAKHLKRLQ